MPEATKYALVTGAGSGVGRSAALALAEAGWSVALVGRRRDALEETAGLGRAGKFLVLPADVAKPEAVDAAFAEVKAKWGRLDLLFNNAGMAALRRCRSTSSASSNSWAWSAST